MSATCKVIGHKMEVVKVEDPGPRAGSVRTGTVTRRCERCGKTKKTRETFRG